jgi:hypothetical protein
VDEAGELGLGCDQLDRHAGLHRAVAHQRLGERYEWRVGGVARRRLGRRLRRLAVAAAGDRGEQGVAAAVHRLRGQSADLLEAILVARRAARQLHERLVG